MLSLHLKLLNILSIINFSVYGFAEHQTLAAHQLSSDVQPVLGEPTPTLSTDESKLMIGIHGTRVQSSRTNPHKERPAHNPGPSLLDAIFLYRRSPVNAAVASAHEELPAPDLGPGLPKPQNDHTSKIVPSNQPSIDDKSASPQKQPTEVQASITASPKPIETVQDQSPNQSELSFQESSSLNPSPKHTQHAFPVLLIHNEIPTLDLGPGLPKPENENDLATANISPSSQPSVGEKSASPQKQATEVQASITASPKHIETVQAQSLNIDPPPNPSLKLSQFSNFGDLHIDMPHNEIPALSLEPGLPKPENHQPAAKITPENPSKQAAPENPSRQDAPESSLKQSAPENPPTQNAPENPSKQNAPENPGNPDLPETSSKQDSPENLSPSENPAKQGLIENPQKHDSPENLRTPETPAKQDLAENAQKQDSSENLLTPETPAKQDLAENSQKQNSPENLSTPETSAKQDLPENPSRLDASENPSKQDAPDSREQQNSPENASEQNASENSEQNLPENPPKQNSFVNSPKQNPSENPSEQDAFKNPSLLDAPDNPPSRVTSASPFEITAVSNQAGDGTRSANDVEFKDDLPVNVLSNDVFTDSHDLEASLGSATTGAAVHGGFSILNPSQEIDGASAIALAADLTSIVLVPERTPLPSEPPLAGSGTRIALAPSASEIVIGKKTLELSKPSPFLDLHSTRAIGGFLILDKSDDTIAIGDKSLSRGSPAITVSGTPVSIAHEASQVVISSSSAPLSSVQPSLPTITHGSSFTTAKAVSILIINNRTPVQSHGPKSVLGSPVSLGRDATNLPTRTHTTASDSQITDVSKTQQTAPLGPPSSSPGVDDSTSSPIDHNASNEMKTPRRLSIWTLGFCITVLGVSLF